MEKASKLPAILTRRVLFATDFSDSSAAALPYALSLARQPGGRLLVAHVVPVGLMPPGFPLHAWLAASAQGRREARAAMERVEAQLGDVEHKTLVRAGDVWGELEAIVKGESIDVIVLGTHARTGLGKAVFGSVAEKVFRHALCPVLTVGPRVRSEPAGLEELHSVLYAADFSQASRAALAYAVALACQRKARLYLLHVVKEGTEWDRAFLETKLRELIPEEAGLACEPRALVREGSPAEVILDAAKELAVDLIVIGPKRRPGLPGTMATAYRVATQAPCPVLTVRG